MITREMLNNLLGEKEKSMSRREITDMTTAKVIVGNRIYPARSVNYESSMGTYPTVEIDAILDPNRSAPYVTKSRPLTIKDVIFNPPATIVFWSDNTKTVVKCDCNQEPYDPEKGIAMAISKKMLGENKYEYYNTFLHWLKKWDRKKLEDKPLTPPIDDFNPTEMYR